MSKVQKACTLYCRSGIHDKYYIMVQWDDGNLTVFFGRRGARPQTKTYSPAKSWYQLLNSKIAKGYRDVSGEDLWGIPETEDVAGSSVPVTASKSTAKRRIVDVEDADDLRSYVDALFDEAGMS